jgi:hypothetical protein
MNAIFLMNILFNLIKFVLFQISSINSIRKDSLFFVIAVGARVPANAVTDGACLHGRLAHCIVAY